MKRIPSGTLLSLVVRDIHTCSGVHDLGIMTSQVGTAITFNKLEISDSSIGVTSTCKIWYARKDFTL